MPGKQTLLRRAEADRIRKLRLLELPRCSMVDEQAAAILDTLHYHLGAVMKRHTIPFLEHYTDQWRRGERVLPSLLGRRKHDLHTSRGDLQDDAESQLRLAFTHPALATDR